MTGKCAPSWKRGEGDVGGGRGGVRFPHLYPAMSLIFFKTGLNLKTELNPDAGDCKGERVEVHQVYLFLQPLFKCPQSLRRYLNRTNPCFTGCIAIGIERYRGFISPLTASSLSQITGECLSTDT